MQIVADEKKSPTPAAASKKSTAYVRPTNRGPVDSKMDVKVVPIQQRVGNIAGTEVDPNTNIPKYLSEVTTIPYGAAPPKISAFERSQLAKGNDVTV
jgi:hypothetical protein